ncbi:hypothetical protein [Rickettsia conorii]|uniref:hypothetical protein n=1 Tax=Rickettsia conorii TaxID=781 RepID=UPI002260E382|nr:hypothetical protein [Rickettsia conorii]UZW38255.1 hypothetical protein OSR38_04580 [Rickettsia conorii subsp. heilongjiangensis]
MQDVIQARMSGMQMSVDFNNAGTYKELGGKAEVASRDVVRTTELSKKFTLLY